ncbi:hypothetical protein TRFO_12686 [Tritrichomonas foetus]|uniref:Uncharacterized protein n=1 Tax=Tritrichomonas foetus TaxID=1144522 RepID=A0A1J4L143_9EUKA|nr:hypothetical protein TRFO_12686 [Tritrichomonas foetus]|eukprot:OHT17155.1 hypothetical protein TRFO_12686 [Tritrichomonas foetus]
MEGISYKTHTDNQTLIQKAKNALPTREKSIIIEECLQSDFKFYQLSLNLLYEAISKGNPNDVASILGHLKLRDTIIQSSEAISYFFTEDAFLNIFCFSFYSSYQPLVLSAIEFLFYLIKGSKSVDSYVFNPQIIESFYFLYNLKDEQKNSFIFQIIDILSFRNPKETVIFWDLIKQSTNFGNIEYISHFIFNEIEMLFKIPNFNYDELFILMCNIIKSFNIPAKSEIWMTIKKGIEMKHQIFLNYFINQKFCKKLIKNTHSSLKCIQKDGFLVLTSFICRMKTNEVLEWKVFEIENILHLLNSTALEFVIINFLSEVVNWHPAVFLSIDNQSIYLLINLILNKCNSSIFKIRDKSILLLSNSFSKNLFQDFFMENYKTILPLFFESIKIDIKNSQINIENIYQLCDKLIATGINQDEKIHIFTENDFDEILQSLQDDNNNTEIAHKAQILYDFIHSHVC